MLHPNLVVTGRAHGKSVFVDECALTPVRTPDLAGLDLFLAWGTPGGTITNRWEKPRPGPGPG
ncbi:hypothetical protein FPZ12_016645, partial [Amycolatopsis acidicola]